MNKLKWVPLHKELNLNVPAMLSDKCISMLISSSNVNESENYVKMFYIGNNIILCFIWGKIIVLELKQHNSNSNNSEFTLEMVYCSVMKCLTYNNEYVVGIKQISMYDNDDNSESTTPNKFAVLTNYNNVYCIDISLVDYYIELLYKTQIQVVALTKTSSSSVTLCQYYNKDTFIVIHDNALYVYEMCNKNKKLIYNCNTTTTNNEVIIHGEITLDYIVVFTSRYVLLLNKRTFALVKVIFTYEQQQQQQTPHTFKGKVFNNKIIYIKTNDEFAIYDIHNTDNNQSLKLSSKKILNKFNFHNVIYVNDDVICLVNDSKSELYVYLQHVPSMNRESTIYDNRNYVVTESHILIIGMNTKKLIIKAKIAKYREYNAKNSTTTTNSSSSKQLQYISKQNENEITFPSLKDIENDYEHKHKALQKVKHNIKLTNNKINFIINTITQRNIVINESQYYNYKQHINHLLTILYNLYFSLHNPHYITEYLSLLSPIHHNLTICFITNFGSHSLILNHKHIYLTYFINLTLTKITTLISIAISSNDYSTYLSLLSFHNELNTILK